MSTQERVERSPRRRVAVAAAVALILAVGLGVLVVVRPMNPEGIDAEWMEEVVEHRSPLWEIPALLFDFLGGGWFGVLAVPVVTAGALLIARRPWAACAFILGSAASSGVTQFLKAVLGRTRPEQILVPLDSPAFPSGHVANAATVVLLLALLLRRRWIAIAGAGYVVLMALSRTYLGAHWVTDTVGGALVGSAMAVLAWVVFAQRLQSERSAVSGSS